MKPTAQMSLDVAIKNIDLMYAKFVGTIQDHEIMQSALYTVKEVLSPLLEAKDPKILPPEAK